MVFVLLLVILFMSSTVMLMLGPLLVSLAADLHTSIAIAGQLATVTSLIWGLTAFCVGPLSDTYGRRRVLLTGLFLMSMGLLAAALSTSYAPLFAARMLTGFGGAMVVPTCYVACADHASRVNRGRGVAWALAAASLGMGVGMPLVAGIAGLASWRTPFWLFCTIMLALWAGIYAKFPRHVARAGHAPSFVSHLRGASIHGRPFRLLLMVNLLLCVALFGLLPYLPAFMIQTYHLSTHDTVLPLMLVSMGVFAGSLMGSPLAGFSKRAMAVVVALTLGGLLVTAVFCVALPSWVTATLASIGGGLLIVAQPLILTQLILLSGRASGTAAGFFALSSQLGAVGGTGIGGLMLSLGGYYWLGLGCLAAALAGAIIMTRTSLDIPVDSASPP